MVIIIKPEFKKIEQLINCCPDSLSTKVLSQYAIHLVYPLPGKEEIMTIFYNTFIAMR